MKHKVGIIVPVYNAEKYLSDCINSILCQTYENFRLILVNDGSKDCSGNICDSFKEQDERITVVHKENGGANSARAMGVAHAIDCDYITFVDSDDEVTINYLEELISHTNQDIDIVIGKVNNQAKGLNVEQIIDADSYRRKLIRQEINWSPCVKLYKKTLFDRNTFSIPDTIKLGEDFLMNIKLAFNSTRNIYLLPKCLYKYNRTPNSVTSTIINNVAFRDILYKEVLLSLPDNGYELYINELIGLRLKLLDAYITSFTKSNFQNTYLYTTLIEDLEINDYPLDKLYYILMKMRNNSLRKIILLFYKFANKIKHLYFS